MDSFEPHFHNLYIRPNETTKRDSARPKDRSLFVLNVPPYITKTNLTNAFEDAGQLEEIYLCDKPGEFPEQTDSLYFQKEAKFSFKCAYLVFKTSRGLQNALKLKQVASGPIKTGLQKWCDEYLEKLLQPGRLQEEIDTYMAAYDERREQEEATAKLADQPDDDGWVTVTKKTHPVTEKKESVFNRIEQKERVKKGRKELKDFYRFQLKDSKVKQLATLRKRFEEDKKKVEVLRNSRRFKPF